VADALIATQSRLSYNQPSVRQDEAEELYLVSEEEDEQEDDFIRLFICAPYTLPAINNNYSGDEEPPIRRLDNNNNLNINLVDTSDINTEPK
jgi:hypothetical protein